VKPVPKTEGQTIQRREHRILEKHNSGRQSVGRHNQIGMAWSGRIQKLRIAVRLHDEYPMRSRKTIDSQRNSRGSISCPSCDR
jgi:hypothetical protein